MPADITARRVLAVAARQHGAVSLAQLVEAGLGRHRVAHLVRSGWLRRRHYGVYLAGPLDTPFTHAMAAVLAYAPRGLLSHHSAGVLWRICRPPFCRIHVTVAGDSGVHSRNGVHAHRCRDLDPADSTRHECIPVTSPARTLLDLAAHLPEKELARATEEAQVHHLVTDDSLNEQFQRHPHHRGTAALRKAIRRDPALTRSEAERRFLELIRSARIPEPRTNVRVGRYEVDFYWPAHDLIVEVDGYAFHSPRSAFERDRRRDVELGAQGHRVMRVTWRLLVDERDALVASLALATASASAGRGRARRGAGTGGAG